jgi:hypothetical protein
MDLYHTLKEALSDCDITSQRDDKSVTYLLKMVLCTKTSNESYEHWTEQFLTMGE